ncbi:hypothetical protein A2686_03765 [Candidatus Woesebacteria bacterium RIFCSPHIGHO2_01_FULL_38_10]|uniref:PsbP C-terminal domain-containing protein n=1 Tax=Candidatus Woesebacteria bacterium RIFCSPLOWO2_01_FULL_39_10b TaxID=1802517 RepID=A0A1F8B7H1_9BACT|nr:MAG: hypothetical protein A2686_03765 [Candidatus Woesebacteria bacterium RIFCSPHIGHO2_01_FULL_38_10]OGM59880.1 MAG: hypothetical protein A2892_02760 [Candidatus Woesebacteria bacterium RIFCSPLOWO2_01_FULL_39_10b]
MKNNFQKNTSDKKRSQSFFQKLTNTKHFPLSLTVFLLIIIFTTSFLIAYQNKKNSTPVQPTATPTPTTTSANMSGWKTYRNEEYEFSFNYPAEWVVGEEARTDLLLLVYIRPNKKELAETPHGLIRVLISDSESIEDHFKSQYCDGVDIESWCVIEKISDKVIGNNQAKRIVQSSVGTLVERIAFKGDLNIIEFNIFPEDKSFEEFYTQEQKIEIFNQILSTFKFIK